MSRVNLPAAQPIYDAAQVFVDEALRRDGSIFTPGKAIWTTINIEELYRRFNESPDASGGGFENKFRRQLAGASPDIYQLAGEVIYVHLLPAAPATMGGHAKRRLINGVLGWSPEPVAIPRERDAALDQGLAKMGAAFLNYRPYQLWLLIEFARDWKRLPQPERERLLGDPWAFKAMLFSVHIDRAYAQREALLHLVHPDTFEAIVSRTNKREFVERFNAYITTPSDDVDRNLAQIRARVDQLYGPGRSLYTITPPGADSVEPSSTSSISTSLPRTLGDRLTPYVRLVALLDGSNYTPEQIVERLGRVSPPLVQLRAAPDPEALVRDLTHLRLLKRIDGSGAYRRWSHLDDRTEEHMLRYAALTLVVPQDDGSYDLPALHAPFDGHPHPTNDWPYGEPLLRWYEEAKLIQRTPEGQWRSLPDMLEPIQANTATAQAVNTFLGYLQDAWKSRGELPPLQDDVLKVKDPDILEERIAAIQRELLVDRITILRIYRALIAGQHVILSGPPGTGKTHLATMLPRELWRDDEPTIQYVLPTDPLRSPTDPPEERQLFRDGYAVDLVTATEDWGVRNVIGGIVPQIQRNGDEKVLVFTVRHGCLTRAVLSNYAGYDGAHVPAAGSLVRQEVRDGAARCRGRWLVIDEFTRAPIDAAFGSLLTTLGGQGSPLMVPTEDAEVPVSLPKDFRLIATLNSFDRHFLNQISEAMKRRFTFIDILPPGPERSDAEQAMVVRRAVAQLGKNQVLDVTEDPVSGSLTWEDVLAIDEQTADSEAPRYSLRYDEPAAMKAIDDFWRIFRAIRRYRLLGTAQAQAVYTSTFSGYAINLPWADALDTALADVLADQLQVINRDEQRVILAYLQHCGDAPRFAAAVREILEKRVSVQRQQAHLALLGLSSTEEVTEANMRKHFALDTPLVINPSGVFAQRLDAFINERGL